jgi:hypothetical protein
MELVLAVVVIVWERQATGLIMQIIMGAREMYLTGQRPDLGARIPFYKFVKYI